MSEESLLNNAENAIFMGIKNDVDPPLENLMATELPSVAENRSDYNDVIVQNLTGSTEEINSNVNTITTTSTKDKFRTYKNNNSVDESDGGGEIGTSYSGSNNGDNIKKALIYCHNNNNVKRKRRRRKSKRSNKYMNYGRSSWKFHGPKLGVHSSSTSERRRNNMVTLVPYNTNKFLMEDHMPEIDIITSQKSRTRDSSFSIDSDENYFYSLPEDEEEFLTKEFSSVYEDARVERLESLSKAQLIQEFLQLQSNYDQLSRRYNARTQHDDKTPDTPNKTRLLEDKINQLASENMG